MKCCNCGHKTNRIFLDSYGERCPFCSSMSEGGGPKIDGILTRNSPRIRAQQSKYEGDFVQPHTYDRVSKRVDINPDFIKLYPKNARDFYSDKEINRAKLNKLPVKKTKTLEDVAHSGSVEKGMKRILDI